MTKFEQSGEEIWSCLRWFYDREHQFPMQSFDPLNGTVINFKRGKVTVTLKEAIENLDDPFTFNEKTEEFKQISPQKISWLIYAQFIWTSKAEMELSDLDLKLFYDQECKREVTFVTFTFPKRPIRNGQSFAVKVTLTKGSEFMAWNMLQQPLLKLEEIAEPILNHPDWGAYFKSQPRAVQEGWNRTRQFSVDIRGRAREVIEADKKQ